MWPFSIFGSREKRFRTMLNQRTLSEDFSKEVTILSKSQHEYAAVLRGVLKNHFELSPIFLADDISNNLVDFPAEEVLIEALEELGCVDLAISHKTWDGTFLGIVLILEHSIAEGSLRSGININGSFNISTTGISHPQRADG